MAQAYAGYYHDSWRKGRAIEDTPAKWAWADMRDAHLKPVETSPEEGKR